MIKMMNKNKDGRRQDFEKMLRNFMKESDAKQRDAARHNNKNVCAKRSKPKKLSAHGTEDI